MKKPDFRPTCMIEFVNVTTQSLWVSLWSVCSSCRRIPNPQPYTVDQFVRTCTVGAHNKREIKFKFIHVKYMQIHARIPQVHMVTMHDQAFTNKWDSEVDFRKDSKKIQCHQKTFQKLGAHQIWIADSDIVQNLQELADCKMMQLPSEWYD